MGFKIPKSTVVIEFDETSQYRGAEVRMTTDITIGKVAELQRLQGEQDPHKLVELMAELIVEWNIEDADDRPVPVSAQAIEQHVPLPMMVELFVGYSRGIEKMLGVDAPFVKPSRSGVT